MMREIYVDYQDEPIETWYDTRGDELIHGWHYWNWRDTFIPDDLDAINDYLEAEFIGGGGFDNYFDAVYELKQQEPVDFVTYDGNRNMAVPAKWFNNTLKSYKAVYSTDSKEFKRAIARAMAISQEFNI